MRRCIHRVCAVGRIAHLPPFGGEQTLPAHSATTTGRMNATDWNLLMAAVGERLRLSAEHAMAAPGAVDALSGARLAEIVGECAGALSQLQRELPDVA